MPTLPVVHVFHGRRVAVEVGRDRDKLVRLKVARPQCRVKHAKEFVGQRCQQIVAEVDRDQGDGEGVKRAGRERGNGVVLQLNHGEGGMAGQPSGGHLREAISRQRQVRQERAGDKQGVGDVRVP